MRRLRLPIADPTVDHVTAAVHRPKGRRVATRSVLLVPGAGGDLDGNGLTALVTTIAELGYLVVRTNLPYREAGRRAPLADRSVPGYRAVLEAAQVEVGDDRAWVVGGKSYGGRVASMAVAAGMPAAGLLFYGYPLHPPGRPEQLRVSHWPDVRVPALFLQGENDPFADVALLNEHVRKLPRRATIRVVEGGDHSLRVTRRSSPSGTPSSEAATIRTLGQDIGDWLARLEG